MRRAVARGEGHSLSASTLMQAVLSSLGNCINTDVDAERCCSATALVSMQLPSGPHLSLSLLFIHNSHLRLPSGTVVIRVELMFYIKLSDKFVVAVTQACCAVLHSWVSKFFLTG
ncbi:hypothetical protein GW17_00015217 [Ensete ventricosum]|nr:hypothetical protein GW17_00015217 [Ensete ventricosum]